VGSWFSIVLAASALGCGGADTAQSSGPDADSPFSNQSSTDAAQTQSGDRYENRDRNTSSSPEDGESGSDADADDDDAPANTAGADDDGADAADPSDVENPLTDPEDGPAAGNPDGDCAVPSEALPADTTNADNIVGDGTPQSCSPAAFISAVARGGTIRFDCGPDPVTITLDRPAKIRNDASDDVVIDGGGKVTLSGGGKSRILYMNTCDSEQVWTTDHCDNQETPRLTVQNLTFIDANSKGEEENDGGGAIWVRGGRFKIVNSRFFNNTCAETGPDVGGAGVRVFSQYNHQPVYVVNSTFGGAEGYGNVCSNGGGLSSIDVSWRIINSLFSHNRAIGRGGNPAEDGTPGGGSGGAIYNDGNTMTLSVCGTRIEANEVNAYGSAIFFVSNNHEGTLRVEDSVIRDNVGGGWNVLPGISMHEDTQQITSNSTIE